MTLATATVTKVQKKRTKKFKRFHSDRYHRVGESWRKPRGIDNRVRRRFRSTTRMPRIGYRNARATRGLVPCGMKKIVVRRAHDLEMLITQNDSVCAEIAGCVSARKRLSIVKRAEELGVRVLNKTARLHKAEVAAETEDAN